MSSSQMALIASLYGPPASVAPSPLKTTLKILSEFLKFLGGVLLMALYSWPKMLTMACESILPEYFILMALVRSIETSGLESLFVFEITEVNKEFFNVAKMYSRVLKNSL